MKWCKLPIFLAIIWLPIGTNGQISPGELTAAHADLEGIFNCTKCHVLGERVSNEKCLDCHRELKSRIDLNKGYHVSSEVRSKNCAECHSDHHGRNFEIIRFDKQSFNHDLAGYVLEGAHKNVDCANCHKADFIASENIRKKEYTFLGLSTKCNVCHEDVHEKTLAEDCSICHSFESFVPAGLFDHASTSFPLKGKHQTVDCKKCHIDDKPDDLSRLFSVASFSECVDCHQDVHRNQLGNKCNSCHVEDSFKKFSGMQRFNHSKTGFELKGSHVKIHCKNCHNFEVNTEHLFQDFIGKEVQNCTSCHEDIHQGKFGNNCTDCHDENSFRAALDLNNFSHTITGFELLGKHQQLECSSCHTDKLTDPLPHNYCKDCHTDYHDSEFVKNGVNPDCADCHVEDGFSGSTYSIDEHAQSAFPLLGAHLATPCQACHKADENWKFKDIGIQCADCHEDQHEGLLEKKYYPDNQCVNCHGPNAWDDIAFAHGLTGFILEGKHNLLKCSSCHEKDKSNFKEIQIFKGLKTECISCHTDVHLGQFEENGGINCQKCHGFENWKPQNFDHSNTRFKLDGAHVGIDCHKCHVSVTEGEKTYIKYKFESIECIVCHK